MRDSYAEVLAALLSGTETDGGDGPTGRKGDVVQPSPVRHGAVVTNMAQGGAGFMLPLFCTMKVGAWVDGWVDCGRYGFVDSGWVGGWVGERKKDQQRDGNHHPTTPKRAHTYTP